MPSDSIVYQIRQRIDYEAFFSEFTTLRGRGAEREAFCVFHENTDTPAMGINIEEGVFICRNPECGASGDFIDFYRRVRSLTFREAVDELARRAGVDQPAPPPRQSTNGNGGAPENNVIDEAIVESTHERLLATPSLMEFLLERRGIEESTVHQYELGHDGQRFYIPIRDELGRCVNIRRYKPDAARAQDKMISWRQGYGSARLWPWRSLENAHARGEPILLVEGEMDCLLALQLGFNAMTATGGAGTWRDQWSRYFGGREVWICYDIDAAGVAGAAQVAASLHGIASVVKVIRLPLAEPENADFTDYVVGHGFGADDFEVLARNTTPYRVEDAAGAPPPPPEEPITLHLSAASRAEHYNLPVRIPVMVSGKTTAPYIVPRQVRMTCGMPGAKMCERCPVSEAAGNLRVGLEFDNNEILQMTNVPDAMLQKQLKQKIGVPGRCGYVDLEVTEAMNVEEIHLIPEIDRSDEDTQYVTRVGFFVGHGIRTNASYLVTGTTVPDPKRQMATHLIHTAIPAQSNIDAFRLTPEVVERLKQFQPRSRGVDALWTKLHEVYDDLERVTRIYQRRDLMVAVDMTYHSLMQFRMQGETLARGWLECLVLGDSRTGKTTIVQRLLSHYRAGEFSSGENTSFAGLVGGLHQVGTSWSLHWGRVPLNDRRLLVIDEAGNLPTDQIARMSSMRSSGIAEVIKIHTERTNARTRQIWISNPRGNKPLSSYTQGVLAVKELIGAPEDIARFDLVVTAASRDVERGVINAQRGDIADPEVYTADLCHQRVMWAWSRPVDSVVWAEDSIEILLRIATEQGDAYQYAMEIPIVEANEQRVKLARIAVAVAAMFFSTDAEGQRVIVLPEHVMFAANYLDQMYRKESLNFHEYAVARRRIYEITNEESVARIIRMAPGSARQLMEQEQLTQRDLREILRISDRDEFSEAIAVLRSSGFLRRQGSSFYLKTPAGIAWLRDELNRTGAAIEEIMPDEPPF